jgi:hypothetical protein
MHFTSLQLKMAYTLLVGLRVSASLLRGDRCSLLKSAENGRSDVIEYMRDVVSIEDNDADIQKLFDDLGKGAVADAHQIKQMSDVLKSLTNLPLNQADGSVRARIGSYHFPLKRTIYTALTIAVTFAGSVVAGGVGGFVVLGGVILGAAQQASDLFTKLSEDELVVYEALGSVLLQWRQASDPRKRATVADVDALFTQRNQASPDVAATLQALRDKDAVKSEVTQGQVHYWIES